jgi:Ca2+-binding RTX toxin-like protein
MSFHSSRYRRWAATAIVSLLAAGAPAAGASADDRVLELVSTGPAGGNGALDADFEALSADGTRAFFETQESLVSADADAYGQDVYERAGGETTLVSTGPAGSMAAFDAFFEGVSADGAHLYFSTFERLVSADGDAQLDIYERAGGQTTLVSTGPAGGNDDNAPARFHGASDDGTRVFLETAESLVSADTDTADDVYERSGGQTTLVSTGPAGGNGSAAAAFVGAADDGSRVFLMTEESLVSADTDATRDLYERTDGHTTLVSTGPAGGNGAVHVPFSWPGLSSDGSRVLFETYESLVDADTDGGGDFGRDVYERAGGQTTLVSTGPAGGNGDFDADLAFRGVSDDGARVFFHTDERLVSADTDDRNDVYERAGGQTTLVSTGPAGGTGDAGAGFQDASADGSRVFFETEESLVSADTDLTRDVYERAGGQTTLVSTGPAGGNGLANAWFEDASDDGTRVFFETDESLVSADADTAWDVYERSGGETMLISTGPAGGNSAVEAILAGASDDGSHVYFETTESLLSTDTDDVEDTYLARLVAPEKTTPPPPAPVPGPAPGPVPAGPQGRAAGACANLRTGTAGADVLTGGALGDRLRGLAGNDRLAGLAGDDCLSGGGGRDRLSGGLGADRLTGGAGKDRLTSGGGDDRINARDGRGETVRCGVGNDRVTADRSDTVIACEQIKLPRRRTGSRRRAASTDVSTGMGSIAPTGDVRADRSVR